MAKSSDAVCNPYVSRAALLALTLTISLAGAAAQTASTYQKPPAAIEELLDAPRTPNVIVSPDGTMLLIQQPATFPSIADVAQPRYRLAGLRFAPRTSSPSAETYSVNLSLQPLNYGEKKIAGLPQNPRFTDAFWSPDSKHVAFLQRVDAATAVGGPGPAALGD